MWFWAGRKHLTPNGSVTTLSLLFTLFLFLSHSYLLSFLITIFIFFRLVRSSNFVKPVFPIPPYVLSFLFYFKLSFIHIHTLYLINHTHTHVHSFPLGVPTQKYYIAFVIRSFSRILVTLVSPVHYDSKQLKRCNQKKKNDDLKKNRHTHLHTHSHTHTLSHIPIQWNFQKKKNHTR